MLTQFLQTYELQEGGQAFKTPEEWLLRIGLYNLTQNHMRDEIQVSSLDSGPFGSLFVKLM